MMRGGYQTVDDDDLCLGAFDSDDAAHHGWMGCPWGLQTITTADAAPPTRQVFT